MMINGDDSAHNYDDLSWWLLIDDNAYLWCLIMMIMMIKVN